MTERAILAILNHLEAKQMATDFLLEVLFGSYLAKLDIEDRDEQLAKISMLARDRTTFSKNTTPDQKAWLEALKPDYEDHVARLCRRISERADDTDQANL
ncbi:MAG: hypothetical protein COA78_32815 [Blastopirellula sp.]|nr:MAG: hypothetical protein COA78_32815 [Blastopirellula sp.]